ncbi:MAG TPA: magnesium/cobalt transporter CorA [Thermoanaerobaculia bacterium]|nr:magnesium/cobalt transporter CorA [Thermoanaerobaculia bacterium]
MTLIRAALLANDQLRTGGAELVDSWDQQSDARIWIDITDPTHESIEPLLEERFGFHELAAEDSVSPNTLPKYDSFAAYDFFIFRAVDVNVNEHVSETYKLAAFLGRNFLVTVHSGKVLAVEDAAARIKNDKRLLERGTDFLLYMIVDQLVDAHFPLLDQIEECVDDLQDRIFANAEDTHLDELLHLKRDVNVLRRHSLPQRELLNQISRGDAKFIQQQHLIYFRDVYDHMFRISETIDVDRDQMNGTMEAYLSVVANRTNEIMKVLTIFSSIMLPLTLIAGIYGMNFPEMPELHSRHGFAFAMILMVVTAAFMLVWFWRRGWIRVGEKQRKKRRIV